jgi:predicted site-specific integrase-resolvase
MKLSLELWAKKHFDPPPSIRTLRAWAREGKIYPAPTKFGRTYYVEESAMHISEATRRPRLVDRIKW